MRHRPRAYALHEFPVIWAMAAALLLASPIVAAGNGTPTPSVETVVERMQAALVPQATMLATARLVADTRDGRSAWNMRIARRGFDDGVLTTVVFSDVANELEDITMLWGTRHEGQPAEILWLPAKRRAKTFVPAQPEQPLLKSDFTRVDLGLLPDTDAEHSMRGQDEIQHQAAWVVESIPAASDHYSRILTWVSPQTWLPLRREYYDRAARLWKVARYDGVVIDGNPTVTAISMDDTQAGTDSELIVQSVRYGDEPHARLFSKDALGDVADDPVWNALTAGS